VIAVGATPSRARSPAISSAAAITLFSASCVGVSCRAGSRS
jgi:hypothetical protein